MLSGQCPHANSTAYLATIHHCFWSTVDQMPEHWAPQHSSWKVNSHPDTTYLELLGESFWWQFQEAHLCGHSYAESGIAHHDCCIWVPPRHDNVVQSIELQVQAMPSVLSSTRHDRENGRVPHVAHLCILHPLRVSPYLYNPGTLFIVLEKLT